MRKTQIVTQENSILGNIANDLAFTIDKMLIMLNNHQSSVNPNMPLRMLCHIAREHERYPAKAIHSTRLVRIQTAKPGTQQKAVQPALHCLF